MNFDEEYYLIERENNDNYPLLQWDEKNNTVEDGVFAFMDPLDIIKSTIYLELAPPVPDKPEIVDYHYMPPEVFSERIAKILSEFNIYNTQLFEALIRHDGKEYPNYFIFHVFNEISCMHRERSNYEERRRRFIIETLSLDEEVLEKIPLEKRLVFRLSEKPSKKLFHKSIVEKVLLLEPKGLRFFRVDTWNVGSAFD